MSKLSKDDFVMSKEEALLLYRNLLVLRGAFLELTENQKVFETTEELKALAGMTQSLIDVTLKPKIEIWYERNQSVVWFVGIILIK